MSKMIDVDDVERILWDHDFNYGGGLQALFDVVEILEVIKEHSKLINIVRCKDCKHYMTIHCTCDGCCISPDWYCADGEQKDEDE